MLRGRGGGWGVLRALPRVWRALTPNGSFEVFSHHAFPLRPWTHLIFDTTIRNAFCSTHPKPRIMGSGSSQPRLFLRLKAVHPGCSLGPPPAAFFSPGALQPSINLHKIQGVGNSTVYHLRCEKIGQIKSIVFKPTFLEISTQLSV